MVSLIIASSDKSKRREYIRNFCKEHTVDRFDITIIEKETAIKQNVGSIGIEEIKNMQKKLFLKPLKSPTKVVVLEDAQLLTTQAQNAMLKVLEEPPDHTIIILSADSKEVFLPTIISRCQIIELKDAKKKLSEKETKDLTAFIENLPKMTIAEKFKKAEQLSKDKEKAIEWNSNLILVLREKMLENIAASSAGADYKSAPAKQYHLKTITILKSFQNLHTLLKTTNVNPRFAIENTLLLL